MGRKDDVGREAFSRLPTRDDIRQISEELQRHGVKYVLVGGLAVNFHGRPRMTHDIDLLIDTSPRNLEKIKKALSFLPDNAIKEVEPEDVQNYTVVRVADEIVIDLIGKIGDVDVYNAGTEMYEIDGVRVVVADLDTLIKTKQGLREKDKADLDFLLLKKRREKNR